jgi:hypothetical protein
MFIILAICFVQKNNYLMITIYFVIVDENKQVIICDDRANNDRSSFGCQQ